MWTYTGLLRVEGLSGGLDSVFVGAGRRPEQRIPAAEERLATSTETLVLKPGDWPGFRGPIGTARLTGVRMPRLGERTAQRGLAPCRRPGWSSFAVIGKRIYTQEQRGEMETVVCYAANTGKELWAHTDKAKFTETMGGPGPRATPTFQDGKIYALGATGHAQLPRCRHRQVVLDAGCQGSIQGEVPIWGFAASPLAIEGPGHRLRRRTGQQKQGGPGRRLRRGHGTTQMDAEDRQVEL